MIFKEFHPSSTRLIDTNHSTIVGISLGVADTSTYCCIVPACWITSVHTPWRGTGAWVPGWRVVFLFDFGCLRLRRLVSSLRGYGVLMLRRLVSSLLYGFRSWAATVCIRHCRCDVRLVRRSLLFAACRTAKETTLQCERTLLQLDAADWTSNGRQYQGKKSHEVILFDLWLQRLQTEGGRVCFYFNIATHK